VLILVALVISLCRLTAFAKTFHGSRNDLCKVLKTMIRVSYVLICLACFPLLSACSSYQNGFSNDSPQLVATPDDVSVMLADAADRASQALETLAAVEYSRSPGVAVAPVAANAPVELQRAITINWVGPVEPITKTLADRASYKFMTIGSPPPVPVVVSIDAENRPVIDVLRDIGLQLGMRGDVRVDSQKKLVEIHYSPNTGVGTPATDDMAQAEQ
jgi:defect-in-organelle-trafficking protein DotD